MEEIGVVDYIISQRVMPNIRMAFQVNEDTFISDLTIGTSVDLPILHSIIQKGLDEISGDELNRIRRKWLLEAHEIYEKSMVNLTVAEQKYLRQNNHVRFCADPSWPPLDFIDESGKHGGLSADLINRIAKRLGITLELVHTDTWAQSLQYIKNGRCEIIPLMNETLETQEYLDFSHPYFDFPTVIATRKDASFIGGYTELYGKKVALQAHYFITEYVLKHHPQIEVIQVENTRQALKMVSSNKAFATVDSLPTVVNSIETLALENVKIVGSVPQQNSMKMGIRKGNELLTSILDKGVRSLSEEEKVGFYRKWLDLEVEKELISKTTIYRIIGGLFIFLLFLVARHISLGRYARKLKLLNKKLHHYSTVDHLTGVLNRYSIEKRLLTEIKRAELTGTPLTLALLDIDFFKSINDTYGHGAGDKVLKTMAAMLQASIRGNDHLGRWGGEEFLIVLADTQVSGAGMLIEKLRKAIEETNFGVDHQVTASFGYSQYQPGESMDTFISRVDNGLYQAKEQGRNKVVHTDLQD